MSSTPRNTLTKQLELLMGGIMVEVETEAPHYELAIDMAIERYRQRSDGSLSEQVIFLTLEANVNEYTLPHEVQVVRRVHRRGNGSIGSSGINFDPFDAALGNQYFLQWGRTGGLVTWELLSEYKKTLSRLFSGEIDFIWDLPTRKLTVARKFGGSETVMITVYAQRHEDDIISSEYSKPWIRDYALAKCKQMLGEAREKFPSGIPGPAGNVVFNGSQLKSEALAEMQRLEIELQNFVASDYGMPFIIA